MTSVDPFVARGVFSWLPAWYLAPIDVGTAHRYSATAWTLMVVAYMVVNGLSASLVEELYFRGWLLPWMARLGRWAPFRGELPAWIRLDLTASRRAPGKRT